jgi:alkanesulfonate monooxygenase SsuD/methylene tetrahydromethanopterin reductase-like flavin-dependent oxidoreductase (luciferase family)
MSTVGHLSPGQWKNPKDKSATKRKLDYWIDLAKLLERGGINALFLADTYGGYDTYEGSLDNCIRRAAQWPMTDPTIVCRIQLKQFKTSTDQNSPYPLWQQ